MPGSVDPTVFGLHDVDGKLIHISQYRNVGPEVLQRQILQSVDPVSQLLNRSVVALIPDNRDTFQ